jgi:hypothetical protein
MSREFKPGDVGTWQGAGDVRVIAVMSHRGEWNGVDEHGSTYTNRTKPLARPLVVIDPEDAEQIKRLIACVETVCGRTATGRAYSDMQAALREFADPKPEEPTGLGAVVEDANADLWVHSCQGGRAQWMRRNNPSAWREWSEIDAVRVLSEGVQS